MLFLRDRQKKKFLKWYLGFPGSLLDVIVIWLLFFTTVPLLGAAIMSEGGEGAGIAVAGFVMIGILAVLVSTIAIPVGSWLETRHHKPVTWIRRVCFAGTAGPMLMILILSIPALAVRGIQGIFFVVSPEVLQEWRDFVFYLLDVPRSYYEDFLE